MSEVKRNYQRVPLVLQHNKINEARFNGLAPVDRQTVRELLERIRHTAFELTGPELAQSRIDAGLSLGQAAKLLGVRRDELERLEQQIAPPKVTLVSWLEKRLNHLYHLDQGGE